MTEVKANAGSHLCSDTSRVMLSKLLEAPEARPHVTFQVFLEPPWGEFPKSILRFRAAAAKSNSSPYLEYS